MPIKVVGINIAKNLFPICVLGTNGQILFDQKIKRDKLMMLSEKILWCCIGTTKDSSAALFNTNVHFEKIT